jgi:serine phosphatase RsbU (regulator of sigma subunit)
VRAGFARENRDFLRYRIPSFKCYARHVFSRLAVKAILLLFAASAAGQGPDPKPAQPGAHKPAPTLVVAGTGRGFVRIDGAWQFHTGDDPRWAQPSYDDSAWETLVADTPWGAQGHPAYTGFAWYRRHIDILPTASTTGEYRVLIPHAEDAYEVYWNGELMGHYGALPPHASWYYSQYPRSFPLIGSAVGVLAIRMWKAPLNAFSAAESGGLYVTPSVGDPDTIAMREGAVTWSYIRGDLFDYSLVLLRGFITVLCLVLWSRNRREQLFLWVGVFTATPIALDAVQHLFLIPFTYAVAKGINQPLYVVYDISLWFLLVWLLQLNDHPRLMRWTRIMAWIALAAGLADGLLAVFWGSATLWMLWADAALDAFILLLEAFPFVLIAIGLRRRLDPSRWAVALAASFLLMIHTLGDASALGQRFTHWTLFPDLLDTPLFTIQGVDYRIEKMTSIVLFAAIIFAVYRYVIDQQGRRAALEQEMQSAREIQQVLIPETLPALKGYAVTSAYTPAQEVGGDFFQMLATPDGSTIVALGDVSGKGLKAAMNVSMIVGVLRSQAETTSSPAEILIALNNCLTGRMQGGFATGIVLRLTPDGAATFANAGHLPPFLNGREFPLEASLPVGLVGYIDYREQTIRLQPGDQLSLYTDGLLEARNSAHELFGFDRLQRLFAHRPTAQQASEAAVAFGQDDDITVLTLTRLEEGVESTTTLVAPILTPATAGD